MTDRKKVIEGLGLIREFLGEGLPGQRQVFETYINVLNDAEELLKEQEEIVPCKECKHRQNMTASIINGQVCFWCEKTKTYRPDGWYCADGERR